MSTITINGKTIVCKDGANVSIINNKVFINGVAQESRDKDQGLLNISISGNIGLLQVEAQERVDIQGDISGNVEVKGSLNCNNIQGDASAGGSVNCENIGGNVISGGSVNCENVAGNVSAKGSVNKSFF